MSEIEKIKRYVKNTNVPDEVIKRYDMHYTEWIGLCHDIDPQDGISLAFNYGMAKGYRAAKAEGRT